MKIARAIAVAVLQVKGPSVLAQMLSNEDSRIRCQTRAGHYPFCKMIGATLAHLFHFASLKLFYEKPSPSECSRSTCKAEWAKLYWWPP